MGKQFEPAPLSTDPYGEEKFKFPLMQAIEEYAEEHDVSILKASDVVVPEYALKLPWRDEEYFKSAAEWQKKDIEENWPKSLLRRWDRNKGQKGADRK